MTGECLLFEIGLYNNYYYYCTVNTGSININGNRKVNG